MKIRKDINANYRAVFLDDGKTIRFRLDPNKPFGIPSTPEIEDIAINNLCKANCFYCYTDAKSTGKNFDSIVDKANDVWGNLSPENRPFQIAIGGAGESTLHPDWVEFVKTVNNLGITPNYTTNGMHLSDEILEATEQYCGGVALSWHPHIEKVFHRAVEKFSSIKTRLNFHVILGTDQSMKDLINLYDEYHDKVEYFVILPYQAAGRGKNIDGILPIWKHCFEWISTVEKSKFAFGALFYDFLMENEIPLNMAIYEPEKFSGYRMMDDSYKLLRKSSYNLEPKNEVFSSISA